MVDDAKLHQFMGQMLSDLGGAASVALVRIGDALGLYKTLHERGPMTVTELAAAAGVNQRYLREWLSHQAASNYLSYDRATQKFELPPEQAMVFAVEDSPVYMMGAFDLMTWMTESKDQVQAVFPTGGGVPWSDHSACFFCAVARFFRPGYHNNLVSNWLPALDGVVPKLERGARVADVGCGHGWSTVLMAKAFPKSQFIGYDFHPSSIEHAAAHAREHGVTANTRFEVATAKGYPEKNFDLVAFFDCLHDMGDPAGAGQLLAASFMDYAMPRADTLPALATALSEVPAPTNRLGVRSGGEGGTTPALAVVINAIVDALAELGVRHIEMPATPERVWRAIREANGRRKV